MGQFKVGTYLHGGIGLVREMCFQDTCPKDQ
jgi:hypothetical protein